MSNRRALVAEDSLMILLGLEMLLEQHGVTIVGPASTVAEALALAQGGDAEIAILDVNLHDEMSFPVADLLIERGVPVIFTTGYAPGETLPPRFQGVPVLQKPYDSKKLLDLVDQAFLSVKAGQGACP
jgi:CheY-like chemotaxis protein